jgi:NAD(P)-dependent dehydrogenase (short-subunit alcohol dehydrogenase family)
MKNRDTLALGLLAGVGLAWGTRAWLRSRRHIELDGRVVIVTGGTTGHGLLVAKLAAEGGALVVLAARDPAELRAAEDELRRRGARDVLAIPTDVTDEAQVRTLVARAIDRFGRIDVLVNNAGMISVGPLETMTLDDFRQAMQTNFWGALTTTWAVLPQMRAQRFGRIANVVSIGGRVPMPHMLPYTASKFALTGLTQGLRAELVRDNIFVTGIYPATMRTGGHTHAWFKGNREAEYSWFGLSDTIPLLSTSAEHVARRLWKAVCDGDPEVIVGWQTYLTLFFNGLLPSWTAELLALVDRGLPAATTLDPTPVQGQNLQGPVPNLLNRLVPPQTRP